VRLRSRSLRTIEMAPFQGGLMSLNFYSAGSRKADRLETGVLGNRREQLVTVVAASLAVLIVAAIAVLLGVA
jgi:hypothetical protein